ncbi:hypothetical protein PoB_006904500 [Plakobranchus ocellatus]|uniref:Uncharacterized protein n=1 Tax=Plakobranchus ocellatus TaxID=259542 RepID=A0AAV4DEX3_9GAST|nr:hypothetical protein PoB_006904500 [Plakobranchus ocellatus]
MDHHETWPCLLYHCHASKSGQEGTCALSGSSSRDASNNHWDSMNGFTRTARHVMYNCGLFIYPFKMEHQIRNIINTGVEGNNALNNLTLLIVKW